MKRKFIAFAVVATLSLSALFGCSQGGEQLKTETATDETQGSQNNGNNSTSTVKFDIEVNYSDKEKLSLTKEQLDQYTNIITLDDETVTITESGDYVLEGKISDGQIVVDVPDNDTKVVTLILNGVEVNSSNSAAIYVKNADKVVISLVEGTTNTFTDGKEYTYDDTEKEEPNACIFSKDDLVISGNGILNVTGNFNNGIASKDYLTITGGIINVTAKNNGIKGKDSIAVLTTDITIEAGGDAVKSDNSTDEEKGYIIIEGGNFDITSGEDGFQAETCMVINGGTFDIESGDDGIHADSSVEINGGDITIAQCYEGIEAVEIVVNDGNIHVTSSDDGFNAAGGNDASAMEGRPGMNNFSSSTGKLTFNGGYIYVNAGGDGLDANGSIEINDGYIIVDGPANGGNGAFDYDAQCTMNGGYLIATGYSQMAQMPNNSSVNCVMIGLDQNMQAGELINISDSNGNTVITFMPAKSYNNIVLCTSDLMTGETYKVSTGGTVTGNSVDGVWEGKYSGGTEINTFMIESTLTTVGNAGGGMGGRPGENGGMGGRPEDMEERPSMDYEGKPGEGNGKGEWFNGNEERQTEGGEI